MRRSQSHSRLPLQGGFTLVELLVVVTIMLVILTMTLLGVNYLTESDRVQGGASQLQSFLSGARDRAIYEKAPRGVRFFVDPINTRSVTAMAYVEPGELWSIGTVDLQRLDLVTNGTAAGPPDDVADGPNVVVVSGQGLGWWQLKRRGLIVDGSRIELPRGSNSWYEIDTSLINITVPPKFTLNPPQPEFLLLRIPYSEPGGSDLTAVTAHQSVPYQIQLPSQLLPQQPALLPENVVIDLDGSRIPVAWRPNRLDAQGQFSPYMDVFFSPRGSVIGAPGAAGMLHFYVCDFEDSMYLKEVRIGSLPPDDPNLPNGVTPIQDNITSPLDTFEDQVRGSARFVPADEISAPWVGSSYSVTEPYLPKDRRIVTVFTQTGAIAVNPVEPTDVRDPYDVDGDGNKGPSPAEPDGFADNPYLFAESGTGVK